MAEPVPVEAMIDAHLHLWRLADGWYGWNTPALGPVHSDASLGEIQPAMLAGGVAGALVVQAADHPAETDWLLQLAGSESSILGVVGWLPVDDPAELHRQLRRWRAEPMLVGVRQLWHDHADPGQLAATDTLRGLEALGAAGLPVDIPDAFPRLSHAVEAAVGLGIGNPLHSRSLRQTSFRRRGRVASLGGLVRPPGGAIERHHQALRTVRWQWSELACDRVRIAPGDRPGARARRSRANHDRHRLADDSWPDVLCAVCVPVTGPDQ